MRRQRAFGVWLAALIIAVSVVTGQPVPAAPAPEAAFAVLGPTLQGSHLAAAVERVGDGHRPVVMAGSECWSTWAAKGIDGIAFRAAVVPEALGGGPVPVALEVKYLDQGKGAFVVQYEANVAGLEGLKWSPAVARKGTGGWQTARFALPDVAVTEPRRIYFRIALLHPGFDAADLCVRTVRAEAGGVQITPTDRVLGAAGVTQTQTDLRLLVLLPGGALPPDGTEVALEATGGEVESPVRLTAGRATARFTAPRLPGAAMVKARCGDAAGSARITLWPGAGVGKPEVTLIDTFADVEDWVQWGPLAQWTWRPTAVAGEQGPFGGKLTYSFLPGKPATPTLDLVKRTFLRGLPVAISLWVNGDSSGNLLSAVFVDAGGQEFVIPLTELNRPGWRHLEAPVWPQTRYGGGLGDGAFHFPVYFRALRLTQRQDAPAPPLPPATPPPSGTLTVSDLTVTTLAPGE
jgi:hypothetical protein